MSITTYGDPVLRRKADPVRKIDTGTKQVCESMAEAMIRANGVGLAAPQIGVSKRIIVIDLDGEFHILINPQLVETSEEKDESEEGCLSVPGVEAPVVRKQRACVSGINLDGREVEVEGEGLIARALQHEIDHLNGVLFIDHLSPARRQSLLKEYARKQREKA